MNALYQAFIDLADARRALLKSRQPEPMPTDKQVEWADSMNGVELSDKQEQQLRGWE